MARNINTHSGQKTAIRPPSPKAHQGARNNFLKPQEIKYLKLRLRGATNNRAEIESGISTSSRNKLTRDNPRLISAFEDFIDSYAQQVRALVPASDLAKLIHDGCYAKDEDGNPDWRARRFYIQMAAEHGQRVDTSRSAASRNSSHTSAPSLNINIVSLSDRRDDFDSNLHHEDHRAADSKSLLRGSTTSARSNSRSPSAGNRGSSRVREDGVTIDAEE